jgi:hypothetical protein
MESYCTRAKMPSWRAKAASRNKEYETALFELGPTRNKLFYEWLRKDVPNNPRL